MLLNLNNGEKSNETMCALTISFFLFVAIVQDAFSNSRSFDNARSLRILAESSEDYSDFVNTIRYIANHWHDE